MRITKKATKDDIAQIDICVDEINRQMAIVKKEFPRGNIYLEDCGNFCIMSDDSHDEKDNPRQDRILEMLYMPDASGGGW